MFFLALLRIGSAGLTNYVMTDAKKAKFLLRSTLSAKYEFLKTMGVFTDEEKPVIRQLIDDIRPLRLERAARQNGGPIRHRE